MSEPMSKTNFASMDKTVDSAPMKKVEFPDTYKNLEDIDAANDPALRRMMDSAAQEAIDGRR